MTSSHASSVLPGHHAHLRLAALIEATSQLVWTTAADGHVVEPQPVWQAFTGAEFRDVAGFGWLRYVHPEDSPGLETLWRAWLKDGTQGESEFRLRRRDGAYRRFRVRAMPVRDPATGRTLEWIGIHEDVTDRWNAEQQLRQRSWELGERVKELQCLYDAASLCGNDGLPIGDIVRGVASSVRTAMREADAAACSIQLGDERYDTTAALPASPVLEQSIAGAQRDGGVIQVYYTRAVERFEGRVFLVEEEALLRAIAVMLQQTVERRRAAAQLAQAQRLDALGQLTGGVAHDFNNLLTVILGSAELLADRCTQPELRSAAETIMTAAESGAGLTRSLLSFARRQALALKRFDAAALAEGMLPLLKRTLGRGIDITLDVGPGEHFVTADTAQLENALLNLAINARDAMPGGGTLSLAVSRRRVPDAESGGAESGGLAPGDYVAVSVRDSGQGMSEPVLKRALEPFFTTKAAGKGSGLGLCMVYGFTQQSGGALRLDSAPGRGTTATIFLPADRSGAGHGKDGAAERQNKLPQGCRVLVVDDDDAIRGMTAAILSNAGAAPTEAENAAAALARLATGESFDLMVTDITLPGGVDGLQLAARARAERPDLRILITTGSGDAAERNGSGFPILLKPYGPRQLVAAAAKLFG